MQLTGYKNLKTENDIMQSWKSNNETIMISVIAISYNHEEFIEKTICGILSQNINIPYEIIIHDDASNDNTRNIIKFYKNKYPNIMKIVLRKENSYSKNGFKFMKDLYQKSVGEFIAIVECDDYWIDKSKLKKQFNILNDSHYNACSTKSIKMNNGKIYKKHPKATSKNKILSTEDIVSNSGGIIPTASLMFRKSIVENLPNWFWEMNPADYYLQVFASNPNGIIEINEYTCITNMNTQSSWTRLKRNELNRNIIIKRFNKKIIDLKRLNKHFDFVYDISIKKRISSAASECLLESFSINDYECAKYFSNKITYKNKLNFKLKFLIFLLKSKLVFNIAARIKNAIYK